MKSVAFILLCVGSLACSHDGRPQSADDQQPAQKPRLQTQMPVSEPSEPLTPASGVGVPRATTGQAATTSSVGSNDSGIDQGDTQADMVVTYGVREALLADPTLSFSAKSITIITRGGRVTLRGMVSTPQERAAVERIARRQAGVLQVDNDVGTVIE